MRSSIRGNPTVEVDLCTKGGLKVTAAVPSGASTGIHEACELRDGDKGRYVGKGVTKAVAAVNNELKAALVGMSVSDQKALDDKMIALDGTPNKASSARTRSRRVDGGVQGRRRGVGHAALQVHCEDRGQHGADGAAGAVLQRDQRLARGEQAAFRSTSSSRWARPPSRRRCVGAECYHKLKGIIKKKYGGDATLIGDEGGFAPPIDAKTGVDLIMEAIGAAGYKDKCKIGMDVAASEFKVEGEDCYDLGTWYPEAEKTAELKMSGEKLGEFYGQLAKDYPIITIEDPFDQDDWAVRRARSAQLGAIFAQFGAIL